MELMLPPQPPPRSTAPLVWEGWRWCSNARWLERATNSQAIVVLSWSWPDCIAVAIESDHSNDSGYVLIKGQPAKVPMSEIFR
jgi:hypothetical protein